MEAFDADGIYEKLSKDKDSISILSEKQAIDKLDKRFEDVISGKIKCNRLSITYIAIKQKRMTTVMRLFRCICLILHRRLLIKKQTKHIKINIICFSMRRQVSG